MALIDLWTGSTDVCPKDDIMEKASPYCLGFSRHAKNTALIDPPSLSLSVIPSCLALSVSWLSVLSSLVQPSLRCLIKLEDNGYFNGNIVHLHKH